MNALPRDVYPALRPGVSLHLAPDRGLLFAPPPAVGDAPARLRMAGVHVVNTAAASLLRACDGTRPLAALARGTDAEGPDGVRRFVERAVALGHLELHDRAAYVPPRVTGSTDCCLPVHAALEVTARCNLRCGHCYRGDGRAADGELDGDALCALLDRLFEAGVRAIELTGGEPLLHPAIGRLVEHCLAHADVLALLTNGLSLTDDLVGRLAAERRRVAVSVSLDGPDAATHDALRGVPGAFEGACRAIRALARAGVAVRAAMSVTPGNLPLVEATLLLARDLGALAFGFHPALPFGRARAIDWNGIPLPALERLHAFERDVADRWAAFVPRGDRGLEQIAAYGNCGAGSRSIAVGPAGEVRLCQLADGPQFVLGDLRRQSLAQIMSTPRARRFRSLVPPDAPACGPCRQLPFCRYCPVRGAAMAAGTVPDCAWSRANPDLLDPGPGTALPAARALDLPACAAARSGC